MKKKIILVEIEIDSFTSETAGRLAGIWTGEALGLDCFVESGLGACMR